MINTNPYLIDIADSHSKDNIYTKQQTMHFRSSLSGNKCSLSEKQAVAYLLVGAGFHVRLQEIDEDNIQNNHNPTPNIVDYHEMIKMFIPNDIDLLVIHHPNIRDLVKSTEALRNDLRNFLNSKAFRELCHFEKYNTYDKVIYECDDLTDEEVDAANEEFYHEELDKHPGMTRTAAGRMVLTCNTQNRLIKETGYHFAMTAVDLEASYIDEEAYELAKEFCPELWAALEELIADIEPNTTAHVQRLKSSNPDINPLARTSYFKEAKVRSLNYFCDTFHLLDDSGGYITDDDQVERGIAETIDFMDSLVENFFADMEDYEQTIREVKLFYTIKLANL